MWRHTAVAVVVVAGTLSAGIAARAEDFYLKDGTKITGTIVSYEKDSFRVQTSFGFAVIYKDRVERIVFAEEAGATASAEPKPKVEQRTTAQQESPARTTPANESKLQSSSIEAMVEHVTGTAYVNETLRFQMYKPPTWRSYPDLVKPGTPLVAALGTPDETTLLLIGREYHRGTLADYARLAESSLKKLYEDYEVESEETAQVGGMPAMVRRFAGSAEGQFWTGMAVYFFREGQYYTLLGLTSAGERTSFQLAVLHKVVNTLEFLP